MGEIATRKYTRKEAEQATQEFIATGCRLRQMLLDLYEREAHTALGYQTFEAYTSDRLGAEWKPEYLRQLRQWARIEREAYDISYAEQSNKSLTFAEARQLQRLSSAEERRAAYQECVTLHAENQSGVYRHPKFISNLTHIVNRRLKGIAPAETKPEPAPEKVQKNQPASQVTTVTPEAPPKPAPSDSVKPLLPQKPTSTPAPAASTVTTYTPPKEDARKEEPEEIDWRSFEEDLQTVLTWVENQHIDSTPEYRKQVVATLCAVIDWVKRG